MAAEQQLIELIALAQRQRIMTDTAVANPSIQGPCIHSECIQINYQITGKDWSLTTATTSFVVKTLFLTQKNFLIISNIFSLFHNESRERKTVLDYYALNSVYTPMSSLQSRVQVSETRKPGICTCGIYHAFLN